MTLDYYDPARQEDPNEHYECIVEDGIRYFGHGMLCGRPDFHADAHSPAHDFTCICWGTRPECGCYRWDQDCENYKELSD